MEVSEAVEVADAVLVAHVGHTSAMSHVELEQRALELVGDPVAIYVALRHLAGVAVTLAETVVHQSNVRVDPAHTHDLIATALRAASAAVRP